jgi:hypothetical protein
VHTRYRKTIRGWKGIENDFYLNGSLNDDFKNEFKKESSSNSKRLSIFFLKARNRDFGEKLTSNKSSK